MITSLSSLTCFCFLNKGNTPLMLNRLIQKKQNMVGKSEDVFLPKEHKSKELHIASIVFFKLSMKINFRVEITSDLNEAMHH